MYFKQYSHIHRRPSGMAAYSSGNGASYHVSISYSPMRILRILRPLGGNNACGPGVAEEGAGDIDEVAKVGVGGMA